MSEKFSYSKLSTFHTCKRAYYINYILGQRNSDNIYSILGTSVHECVEGLLQQELTREQAIEKFEQDLDFADVLGFTFISDKTKNNFTTSIYHYLNHFEFDKNVEIEIEKPFCLEFDDYCVQGYIDLIIHNSDGTVSIVDLKTSSMYSKKSIEEDHCYQLLIYALALENEGYIVRDVSWDMMKYAQVKTKRSTKNVLRSELDTDEFKPCKIYFPLNEESKKKCLNWIEDTVKEIRSMDIFDNWECIDNSFYCQNICKQESCERFKELKRNYAKNFN